MTSTSKEFADEFVRLHNAASKEYKEAFKKAGAKIWQKDHAHLLKPQNRNYIEDIISRIGSEAYDLYDITRPLTVLDSYPQIKWANINDLEYTEEYKTLLVDIDKIYNRYKRLWSKWKKNNL